MDYEALKDQWSDVEDRDGIRLSWNTFPSSRMVCITKSILRATELTSRAGSVPPGRAHRSHVYSAEGEARFSFASVRAGHLQASL